MKEPLQKEIQKKERNRNKVKYFILKKIKKLYLVEQLELYFLNKNFSIKRDTKF